MTDKLIRNGSELLTNMRYENKPEIDYYNVVGTTCSHS